MFQRSHACVIVHLKALGVGVTVAGAYAADVSSSRKAVGKSGHDEQGPQRATRR
jgi:hypothetical protein